MEEISPLVLELKESPTPNESTEIPASLSFTTDKEKQLLEAAADGQLEGVRIILEYKESSVDINCTDALGRTPLIVAAENEQVNEQMVQLLIENGADTKAAILHAVTQEKTESLRMLLRYCPKEREKLDKIENTKFVRSVSSLMLACKLDNYEMVKLLVSHGERVIEHGIDCTCITCISADSELSSALIRLESYKALSSPMYISAQYMATPGAAEDPIYTAFELSEKLRKMASVDYEYENEYMALSEGLDMFPVDLLDECVGMKEVQSLMKMEKPLKMKRRVSDEIRNLCVLKLAVKYENEKFIAHPHSQLVLNNEVFREYPKFRNASWKIKYSLSSMALVFLPVFILCYMFLPNSRLTRILRTPLVKYVTFISSFLLFLLLLILTAFQPVTDFLRFDKLDWLVFVFVMAYILDTANEIYHNGWSQYFSNWYNYVFIAMLVSFILYYVVWGVGRTLLVDYFGSLEAARRNIAGVPALLSFKAVLYSYGFYSVGILSAFIYLLSTVHLHPTLGPLLISLIRMLEDVGNFFLFFLTIFVAFVACLKKLYLQYDQSYTKFFLPALNNTAWRPQRLGSLWGSSAAVFWSLFGEVDLNAFNTEAHYSIIEDIGKFFFAVFNVVAVLVALNMLIAMLNESYSRNTASNDVKWKYSRTKMLLTMMHRSSVLPPPFNVIPTPRAVVQLFQWILRLCRRQDKCCEAVNCCTKRKQRKNVGDDKRHELIRQLVLRYLCTAENKKGSKSSTAEELDRARRDLARLLVPLSVASLEKRDSSSGSKMQTCETSRKHVLVTAF